MRPAVIVKADPVPDDAAGMPQRLGRSASDGEAAPRGRCLLVRKLHSNAFRNGNARPARRVGRAEPLNWLCGTNTRVPSQRRTAATSQAPPAGPNDQLVATSMALLLLDLRLFVGRMPTTSAMRSVGWARRPAGISAQFSNSVGWRRQLLIGMRDRHEQVAAAEGQVAYGSAKPTFPRLTRIVPWRPCRAAAPGQDG